MKKYKLTDKWPEPFAGKIAYFNGKTGYDCDIEQGVGVLTWSKKVVEQSPELFEPVQSIEFEFVDNDLDYDGSWLFTLRLKNKIVLATEIVKVLNDHFNKTEQ